MVKSELRGNTMNDIEQHFFKVFGIEKRCLYPKLCKYKGQCECTCAHYTYPEITDRKLLEMICILVKTQTSYPINKSNIKDIKDEVLQRCVNLKSYIKHQIQQLFKEEQ